MLQVLYKGCVIMILSLLCACCDRLPGKVLDEIGVNYDQTVPDAPKMSPAAEEQHAAAAAEPAAAVRLHKRFSCCRHVTLFLNLHLSLCLGRCL